MATLISAKLKTPISLLQYLIQTVFVPEHGCSELLSAPLCLACMQPAQGATSGNQAMSNCAPNQNSQSISIPSGQWYPVQIQIAKIEMDADSVWVSESVRESLWLAVCTAAAAKDFLFIDILWQALLPV